MEVSKMPEIKIQPHRNNKERQSYEFKKVKAADSEAKKGDG